MDSVRVLIDIDILSCYSQESDNSVSVVDAGKPSNSGSTNTPDNDDIFFKSQDGCGRKGAGSIRIVGGTQIRRHEYPWLCSLRRRGGHICGITLLSVYPKKTILVGAAHCYNKESKILRSRGRHDLK